MEIRATTGDSGLGGDDFTVIGRTDDRGAREA